MTDRNYPWSGRPMWYEGPSWNEAQKNIQDGGNVFKDDKMKEILDMEDSGFEEFEDEALLANRELEEEVKQIEKETADLQAELDAYANNPAANLDGTVNVPVDVKA